MDHHEGVREHWGSIAKKDTEGDCRGIFFDVYIGYVNVNYSVTVLFRVGLSKLTEQEQIHVQPFFLGIWPPHFLSSQQWHISKASQKREQIYIYRNTSCHTRGEHLFMFFSDFLLINTRMLTQNQWWPSSTLDCIIIEMKIYTDPPAQQLKLWSMRLHYLCSTS